MHPAALDGSTRGHQRLGRHLAAESALAVALGVLAPKEVDLDILEIQQVNKKIERQ
jgi:hypothetical protein